MRSYVALTSLAAIASPATSFTFAPNTATRQLKSVQTRTASQHAPSTRHPRLYAAKDDDTTTDDNQSENPYADPNYPDLEFINYDDPDYQVDQGLTDGDEFLSSRDRDEANIQTLAEIEAMREERRRRNDEFQFETYHANVLRGGEVALGEWTVFQTDTFMGGDVVEGRHPQAVNVPRLLKWDKVLKVVSRGSKVIVDAEAEWRVDGERIVHEERLASVDDFPAFIDKDDAEELVWDETEMLHLENRFWPKDMESLDFRGPGGNMCVGKAYTICDAVPLVDSKQQSDDEDGAGGDISGRHEGPFSEMRTELGVQENGMRFRIKLDYGVLEEDESGDVTPPLHLRTLTVCRETLDGYWPNPADNASAETSESTLQRRNQDEITNSLFGAPGAPGGLYDPPPVGSEERAIQNYMLLDFEGGATVLLPHRLDQHHTAEEGDGDAFGWVTSLDWTPGKIRYQVDRKVLSGPALKGLKTLELSEVQGEDADRWRPKDGGTNMRQ